MITSTGLLGSVTHSRRKKIHTRSKTEFRRKMILLAGLNCKKVRLQHGRNTSLPEKGTVPDSLKPRNYSPRTYTRERNPDKIYQFCLARQKPMMFELLLSCGMQSLSNLVACIHNPVQKFESDAVLLQCFGRS